MSPEMLEQKFWVRSFLNQASVARELGMGLATNKRTRDHLLSFYSTFLSVLTFIFMCVTSGHKMDTLLPSSSPRRRQKNSENGKGQLLNQKNTLPQKASVYFPFYLIGQNVSRGSRWARVSQPQPWRPCGQIILSDGGLSCAF